MSKTIQVTITSTIYKKLGDYLQDHRSPAFPYDLKNDQKKDSQQFDWNSYARQFVAYSQKAEEAYVYEGIPISPAASRQNYNNIVDAWKNYPDKLDEINIINLSGNLLELPLKPGIKFFIPIEKISKEALLTQGVEVVSNNEPAFKAQALIDLESDLGYRKVFNQESENIQYGDLKYQYPDLTVWIWCRALSDNNSVFSNDLKGQIFNITPFITNLSTSHTKSGATFSLNLTPINAEKDNETGQWALKQNSVIESDDEKEVVSESFTHERSQINGIDKIVRSQFLFHNIISSNDLIFIRFETLEKEAQQRLKDNSKFVVDKSNLAERIYDMIGLVDSNTLASNFESNDIQISVRGRDLSKLFIEDGSYFYSMEQKQGVFYLQGGASRQNELTQRIISDNAYLYLGLYYNNSIEDILKFVIQQLTNIRIVPDDLFESYGKQSRNSVNEHTKIKTDALPDEIKEKLDRRNTNINNSFFSTGENRKDIILKLEKRKADLIEKEKSIIQKIQVFRQSQFIYSINEFRSTISTLVYNELKNFINYTLIHTTSQGHTIAKINQNEYTGWRAFNYNINNTNSTVKENTFPSDFVTDNDDTKYSLFGNFTDDSVRKLNSEQAVKTIVQDIYLYLKEENEIKKVDFLEYPESIGKGIWQIVKLVIDKKVANRLLIDSSISSATGSLINYLKKVAQEPFVEIFMDTYYDQFYIIVRQPPTNKSGIISYLTGNYQDTDNLNKNDNSVKSPAIVNIEEIDIINESLSFDESNIYSWYHFTPQAAIIANATQFTTAYLPAIYFPEYASIWGSKSLDFIHNYSNYYSQYSKENASENIPDRYKQMYYDMQYVVESNQYMPFSRKGSITISGGDRRMKIGNPIRLVGTGEIFWIDSISNSFTINNNALVRQTTLQLSRGLNEAFIYGVKGSVLNSLFKNEGFKFSDNEVFSYFNIINTELNFSKTRSVYKTKQVEKKVPKKKISENDKNYENIEGSYDNGDVNTTFDIRNPVIQYAPLLNNDLKFHLATLDQKAQVKFSNFIAALQNRGWEVVISTLGSRRTRMEQLALIRQSDGSVNASPDKSKHVKGFALDINVIATKDINGIKKGTQLKKGYGKPQQAEFNKIWIQSGIPQLAQSFDLIWGGYFSTYHDNVHFEMKTGSFSVPEDYDIEYETVNIEPPIQVFDEAAVFSNFKVNEEVFNFFLRKQQMGFLDLTKKIENKVDKIKSANELFDNKIISPDQFNLLSSPEKKSIQENMINNQIKNS